MEIKSHRDLIVWQKAIALAAEVGRARQEIAGERALSGSRMQLRRAAMSVSSEHRGGRGAHSIAATTGASSRSRAVRCWRSTSQLEVAVVMGYLQRDEIARAEALSAEVLRMLTKLWRVLRGPRGRGAWPRDAERVPR